VLVISGIGQITGHIFRFLEPIVAWATHRRLGLALTVTVLLHMFALLLDKYQKFTLGTLFVPFISAYKPLYVGLGILAFYALILVTVTSLSINRSHPRAWKLIHFVSYVVLALTFVHGLFAGTDLAGGLGRMVWVAAGALIIVALLPRLRRSGSLK
jgi:DMSO/TMAO reductase YedYZ heme-binding membrane subunit